MKITENQLLALEKLGYNPRKRFYKYFIPREQLPEQQVIVDWLRDTYNLIIEINHEFPRTENKFHTVFKDNLHFYYELYYYGKDFNTYEYWTNQGYDKISYEECLNQAINQSINILKQ